ncbi:hypothetical protein BJX76DRAFT_362460 [Aspergillus varians]
MSASAENPSYNSGPHLLRDIWALAGVSCVVVAFRILAKTRIKKFSWDDVLMICALVLALVGSAILTVAVHKGYGRPMDLVSDPSTVILYDYIGQTFGTIGGVAGRVAFILFVLGILGTNKRDRIILWILVGGQVIVNVLFILIIFLQCPGHASAIFSHSGNSEKCWDLRVQTYYGYFQGAFNSATDLYLAAFPTFVFWNLHLTLQVKIGLIVLLGLGIFAMVASVIKTTQLHILANANSSPTSATVNLERWLYIETYIVIITASIPLIRSLFRFKTMNSSAQHTPYGDNSYSGFTSRGGRGSVLSAMPRMGVGRTNFNKIDSEDNIILQETSGRMKADNDIV